MIDYQKKASELYLQGYNCSQSVFGAFIDLMELDLPTSLKIASSFGGGMGQLKEVCGALTGAFMALGILYGYNDPQNKIKKQEHYDRIRRIGEQFKEHKRSYLCRDLLEYNKENPSTTIDGEPIKQCDHLVRYAAFLVQEELNQHPYTL